MKLWVIGAIIFVMGLAVGLLSVFLEPLGAEWLYFGLANMVVGLAALLGSVALNAGILARAGATKGQTANFEIALTSAGRVSLAAA